MSARRGPAPRRPRAGHPRAAALALALVMVFAVPVRPADAGRADNRVRALGEEWLARLIERSPEQATRLGARDHDHRLVPVTQATLDEDRAWNRAFLLRLAAIAPGDCSPPRALERGLLVARAEATLASLEHTRPFERDPTAYLPLVAESVRSALGRAGASPCARVRAAAARLAAVPEVLRAARINLRAPPAALIEDAIPPCEGALRFYRETIPALAGTCRDPRLQADLAEADTAAVRALEAFLAHLYERRAAGPRPAAIGDSAVQRWMNAALMEPVAIDTVEARTRRMLDAEVARVAALAAKEAEDAPGPLDGDAPVPLERWRLDEAIRRVNRHGQRDLLSLPGGVQVAARAAPPYATEPVTLAAPGPWDPRSGQAWLEIASLDGDAGAQRFAPWDLDRIAMREAWPGRLARLQALRAEPSPLRRALLWSWPGDEWAGYAERRMLESGYGQDDPQLALAAARAAVREHARALASLGLHRGTLTHGEAMGLLVRCGLEPADAEAEARRAARQPQSMSYTCAVSELIALRERLRHELGAEFSLRRFDDALVRLGGAPIGLVRPTLQRELGRAVPGSSVSGATR